MMNAEEIQDTTIIAIYESQAQRIEGQLLATLVGHHKWTKMVPSTWREGRLAIRSMLYVSPISTSPSVDAVDRISPLYNFPQGSLGFEVENHPCQMGVTRNLELICHSESVDHAVLTHLYAPLAPVA